MLEGKRGLHFIYSEPISYKFFLYKEHSYDLELNRLSTTTASRGELNCVWSVLPTDNGGTPSVWLSFVDIDSAQQAKRDQSDLIMRKKHLIV